MNPDAEKQNDILFQEAQSAETSSDWTTLRSKCDQGLRMEGLAQKREALFRRLRAKALYRIATARRDAYDANLLQEAIGDAKKVAIIYSHPEHYPSYGAHLLAEAHAICGDASYALSMTPSGSGQKGELLTQAIDQYEKSLHLEPQNNKIRELLEHVKKHPAATAGTAATTKEQKSGCFIATAASGNVFAPEVIVLSAFRDDVLLRTRIGRAFVRFYYAVSPPIAALIARSSALRRAAMTFIVRPAVRLVRIRFGQHQF